MANDGNVGTCKSAQFGLKSLNPHVFALEGQMQLRIVCFTQTVNRILRELDLPLTCVAARIPRFAENTGESSA